MLKRYTSALLVLGMMGPLAGCTTTPMQPSVDYVDARIEQSAERLASLLEDRSNQPKVYRPDPAYLPPHFQERYDAKWHGDIEPFLRSLTNAAGMRIIVTGRKLGPVPISIDVRDARLFDILRQAGAQTGKRADVLIGVTTIEIQYRGV